LIYFYCRPASTQIYTLSLHDALPIYDYAQSADQNRQARVDPDRRREARNQHQGGEQENGCTPAVRAPPLIGEDNSWNSEEHPPRDRKSTRLNSSHVAISYAVFCLKKK